MLTYFGFSSSSPSKSKKLEEDQACSATWRLSLEAFPLEDSFFVDNPPSTLPGLRSLKVFAKNGGAIMIWIMGAWLNEANVLLTWIACKSGWQGKDPSIEHATNPNIRKILGSLKSGTHR